MGRRQGSIVDATIATILCQCVENSQSCGLGGGHFMTIYNRFEMNKDKKVLVYCLQQVSYLVLIRIQIKEGFERHRYNKSVKYTLTVRYYF